MRYIRRCGLFGGHGTSVTGAAIARNRYDCGMTDTIPDMDLVNMTIRVPPELMAAIDKEAARLDRPRAWVIRRTLSDAYLPGPLGPGRLGRAEKKDTDHA
jgi:hypothetical protein